MHAFLIALQFLTRIPVFIDLEYSPKDRINSALYYPLVGLLMGSVLYFIQDLLASIDVYVASAILLSLWVMVTGGLHLDGLADSADAWAGGFANKKRSLEIMKDPRCGPIAVVVLLLLLLLKFTAIAALLKAHQAEYLILSPILGRMAVLLLLVTTVYARENGLGSELAEKVSRFYVSVSLLLSSVFVFYWLDFLHFIYLFICLFLVFYLLRRLMMKRLDGMTGDTAGAMVEVIELSVLILGVFIL